MGKRRSPVKRTVSRREFLKRAGAGLAAAPLISACGTGTPTESGAAPAPSPGVPGGGASSVFTHGIASGDPMADRVILWTRVQSPAGGEVPVTVRVFLDEALTQPVTSSSAVASAARDHTVKIDQAGLAPATTYYYQFEALGEKSAVGRTRTAPAGASDRLRFAVVSCSSYAHGFFNAYRTLAQRNDIDAVLHLGDYIYEYGTGEYGDVRPYEPAHEMITLEDYRIRHAYYKREADLMELHRRHPFITVWDDHESTDNSWRDSAVNHTEGTEGVWTQRKAWAQQAYDEWMPIRYPESGNVARIWRKFNYGNLADIFMLDTRLFDRDEPDGIPASAVASEAGRRMLGPEQRQWLLDNLAASTAQWKLIGGQVVFHQWHLVGAPNAIGAVKLNGDSWDGYQDERSLIHDGIEGIDNIVFLAGDVHSSWAADVTRDPNNPVAYNPLTGAGSLAVEFVAPAITSPFAIEIPEGQQAFLLNNPHIRYTDWDERGYLLLDLNAERAQGEWWYISGFTTPGGTESFGTAYAVASGDNSLGLLPVLTPS